MSFSNRSSHILPINHLGASGRQNSNDSFMPEYLKRTVSFNQMDIEYTFWQMFYLCVNPTRVYKNTVYHKQTKSQWARDDPGFVVVLFYFIFISAIAYAVAFHIFTIVGIAKIVLYSLLFDFITIGLGIATIGWWISNKFLKQANPSGGFSVDQKVEWLYCFDIHCNSYFPQFLLLHVIQFYLLPLLTMDGIFSRILGNTLYAIAFCYYFYITFLGYNSLPFLQNTMYFLYPIGLVIAIYLVALISGVDFAFMVLNFYYGVTVQ